jgi:hypothetical protein
MKKRKKNSKRTVEKDIVLEEHVVKLIEKQNKQVIKNSIDAVVKKEKPKNKKSVVKKAKPKGKIKDVYGGAGRRDEYKGLQGAGVYDQIKFSPFIGFLYKSNIKNNNEFYEHLAQNKDPELKRDGFGERNFLSSEMVKNYARKTTLNFLMGEAMMGIGGVNDISVEEKELMNFNLYDRAQKAVYLAELKILGFGTDKTMNAPLLDKAA